MLAFIILDDILFYGFWLAVSAGLTFAIAELTKKKVKMPVVEPNELKMPEVDEGIKYTINFGTNWIQNPLLAWWGDTDATAIRRHYYENEWGNQKRVHYTIGFHYAVGIHFILTQGQNDGIKQLKLGETVVWPDPDSKTTLQADGATSAVIDEPNLFGGEESEGGVVGTVTFQYGGSSQTPASYLTNILGANISAFRGLTCAILEQVRFGTSAYPKMWSFMIKRTDILTTGETQWYPSKSAVGTYNLNAAHILRECYTDSNWGFGHPSSLFPDSVWEAAADTLYTEGLGLSIKWEDQNQTLEEFVNDVLRYIDARIYQEPETGEFILKLVRYDYTPAALDEYDDSDIVAVSDFTRGAHHKIPTSVSVRYWDMYDNKAQTLGDDDIAVIGMQNNKLIRHEVGYVGINSAAVAGKLAARDRRQLTAMPAIMAIQAKRTMSGLRPGDVFKLTWPQLGISGMIVRVGRCDFGELSDGICKFEVIEDVFAMGTALYSAPPATGWTDPRNDPAEVPAEDLFEAPFWEIVLSGGVSSALTLDDDAGFLMVSASKPSGDAYDYELMLRDDPAGSFSSAGRGTFTPTGLLDSFLPLNAVDATITLTSAEGLEDVEVGTYAIIEDEIVKVLSVTPSSNQVQIARGCLDTVPAYHSGDDSGGPGARVWFAGSACFFAGKEYTTSDQPGVKILPRTPLGQLAIGDATAFDATAFSSRMNRPYPPGNFRVNAQSYPATFSGQPTLSWNHRDRTQQTGYIYEHSDTGVGPEAGTTYTITIYDETGVGLLRTVTGLTGTTYTYTYDDEIADSGLSSGDPLNSSLRFVLKSVRGGYDSWQSYDLTVNRA